ncbi:MAG: hypothetical protein R3256_08650 [Thalassovita sp.]|nr:hypothetical protein [Thalassovita sp.]
MTFAIAKSKDCFAQEATLAKLICGPNQTLTTGSIPAAWLFQNGHSYKLTALVCVDFPKQRLNLKL